MGIDSIQLTALSQTAVETARKAGVLLRREFRRPKRVEAATLHDLKLELDVRCQRLIRRELNARFPGIPVLGEEENLRPVEGAEWRWVVDPIDGTVNYAHGIPHACVAIALQERVTGGRSRRNGRFETRVGVVYDPFCDELWTATGTGPARLNGRRIRVVPRPLKEAVISVGFGKTAEVLAFLGPMLAALSHRVRKVRIMGSAALALCYVAAGRFDAFIEPGLRLWDIAAAGFVLERAGGVFFRRPVEGEERYAVNGHNGRVGRNLAPFLRQMLLAEASPEPHQGRRQTRRR